MWHLPDRGTRAQYQQAQASSSDESLALDAMASLAWRYKAVTLSNARRRNRPRNLSLRARERRGGKKERGGEDRDIGMDGCVDSTPTYHSQSSRRAAAVSLGICNHVALVVVDDDGKLSGGQGETGTRNELE